MKALVRLILLSLLLAGGSYSAWAIGSTYAPFVDSETGGVGIETGPWGPIGATVDIKPESLGKKSQGAPVTAFIELPSAFDVSKIEVASIRLCRGTAPCADGVPPDGAPGAKPKIGDHDGDGIPDLKVTFDRAAVIALVANVTPQATVTFIVSGIVKPPNRIFAGSDTVKLVDPDPTPTPTPTESPREATVIPTPTASPDGASPTPPAAEGPGDGHGDKNDDDHGR